jgi:hypothetical protein
VEVTYFFAIATLGHAASVVVDACSVKLLRSRFKAIRPKIQESDGVGLGAPVVSPWCTLRQDMANQPLPLNAPIRRVAVARAALFVGWLGVHKFMMGKVRAGLITLAITLIGSFLPIPGGILMFVVGAVESRKYRKLTDQEFETEYLRGSREWF